MINFSLMGAGRIGKMHAKFIALHPKAKLKYVYDVNSQFAEEVAKSTGCSIASSPEEAINADRYRCSSYSICYSNSHSIYYNGSKSWKSNFL